MAASSAEVIELDLAGLTSVLAVLLGIGVIILIAWMWRIGRRLEREIAPAERTPRRPAPTAVDRP